MATTPTADQRRNLARLAHYLRQPILKFPFDCRDNTKDPIAHGPHSGVPRMPQESYIAYRRRGFGLDTEHPITLWICSYWWGKRDNTPAGAADRIDYFLRYGLPKHWKTILYDTRGQKVSSAYATTMTTTILRETTGDSTVE